MLKGIGPVNARNLVAYCGGVDPIFSDKKLKNTLEKVPGIGPKLIASITDKKVMSAAEKELEYVREHKLRMLFYLDDDPEQGNQHGGFSLSKEGEFIGIYGGFGTVLIDGHEFGLQMENVSIGLHPVTGLWVQLVCATPGAPNIICDKHVRLPLVQGQQ